MELKRHGFVVTSVRREAEMARVSAIAQTAGSNWDWKGPAARRALLYCVPTMFDSLGVEVPFTT